MAFTCPNSTSPLHFDACTRTDNFLLKRERFKMHVRGVWESAPPPFREAEKIAILNFKLSLWDLVYTFCHPIFFSFLFLSFPLSLSLFFFFFDSSYPRVLQPATKAELKLIKWDKKL